MRGNGRRSDIDGESVDHFLEARPRGDDLPAVVDRDGNLPVALAQDRLQRLQDLQVAVEAADLPFPLKRLVETAQIPGGLMHIRFADFNVVKANQRI